LHSTKKDNHSIRTLHDEETKQRQERSFLSFSKTLFQEVLPEKLQLPQTEPKPSLRLCPHISFAYHVEKAKSPAVNLEK
jgi:hypothetical protein